MCQGVAVGRLIICLLIVVLTREDSFPSFGPSKTQQEAPSSPSQSKAENEAISQIIQAEAPHCSY